MEKRKLNTKFFSCPSALCPTSSTLMLEAGHVGSGQDSMGVQRSSPHTFSPQRLACKVGALTSAILMVVVLGWLQRAVHGGWACTVPSPGQGPVVLGGLSEL